MAVGREITITLVGERPAGREQVIVGANPVRLDPPDIATVALVQVLVADVRVTLDGTTPSTGLGLVFSSGSFFRLTGMSSIRGLLAVRGTATDAVLEVEYFTPGPAAEGEIFLTETLRPALVVLSQP